MLSRLMKLPDLRARLIALCVCGLMFMPWGGLVLWRYVYGFINELTPATWILFFVWFGFPETFKQWVKDELPFKRRLILFLSLLIFYVLALGSGSFDPYAYGYQPWAILAGLAAWVAWRGLKAPGLTLLLGIDLGVYAMHGLTSDNLWDSLFDPVLMIVLGISLIRGVMSRRKFRTQSTG